MDTACNENDRYAVITHLVNIVLINELIKEGEEGVEVMHDLQHSQ